MTFLPDASGVALQATVENKRLSMRNKLLRTATLNNVKSNFSFNEINKKDLPAIYSTVFRCLLVVLQVFLVLLDNHNYSPHKTKSRLVISIWQDPGPVATKMSFFRRNSSLLQIFSASTQEGNLLFLSKRSAQKKLYNFPIKLNHLCRASRHVWLSSSTCDCCGAYQLICIMTINTYADDGCKGSFLHSARA